MRFRYGVIADRTMGGKSGDSPLSVHEHFLSRGDSHGEGDRVLRPEELPHTIENGIAAMWKGYRVLHSDKEIRLAPGRHP